MVKRKRSKKELKAIHSKSRYQEGLLDVAPTHVRGGHTLSEHLGRERIEKDPHSFGRLYVSEKRKKIGLKELARHKKLHAQQRLQEARAKKKPHLDYKPITAELDDDEITSFF